MMHAARIALASITAAVLLSEPSVAQTPKRVAGIDEYVSDLARCAHFSGTVLVALGPEVVFEKSYGRTDFRSSERNTQKTLFAVASVTKPMTGIAARLLAKSGVLSLEDSVAKWLPYFPNATKITVAQLLGHRSGIPHRVTEPSDERRPQTAESMTQLASRAPSAHEPNTQRLYSSAGYSVLARVLELASGRSYAQLLQELVLTPAGVLEAIDATDGRFRGQRATGHFWTHEGPLQAPPKDLSFLVGAGSLWASARNLYDVSRRVSEGGYGDAAVGAKSADGAIHWTGVSNGFFASLDYDPATEVTVVITSNLLTGAADWIRRDAPLLLLGEWCATPSAPSPTVVQLSESRQRQLEGVYSYNGSQHPLVFLKATTALLGGEYLLLATSEHSFFAPQNYAEVTVVDSVGSVEALELHGPYSVRMPRIR